MSTAGRAVKSGSRGAARWLVGTFLALWPAGLAHAQVDRDTLLYHLALVVPQRHVLVEARLTVAQAGRVGLAAPPALGRAGTRVVGFIATDDRGVPLAVTRSGSGYAVDARAPGAIRYRYRLDFENSVASGSTASGFDSTRLYAVSRSVFVAPEPASFRKTSRRYPAVRVRLLAPRSWSIVTGWGTEDEEYRPDSGEELLGATIAAAPDYRIFRDSLRGSAMVVAIRGRRNFPDSALIRVITESLRRGARVFGDVPVPLVTYTSDLGQKGRTSGSLQGMASVGLVWEPGELLERARSHDTFHETLHFWFGGALETERWWTEGVTDYFAARLYAEWKERPEDLATLCYESYRNYLGIRHRTAMTMHEEDRRRIAGDNTSLLVYRKGMLAGLILDAAIRRGATGRASLDDVARRLLSMAAQRRARSVREAEIGAAVAEIGGDEARRAWNRVVTGSSLLAEDEVTEALRAVTGRTLPPPPARRVPPKVLSSYSNQ